LPSTPNPPFPQLRHYPERPLAAVLRAGEEGSSSSAMEEETKAGPNTDANNEAAIAPAATAAEAAAAPPPSSSETAEAEATEVEEEAVGEVLEQLVELVEEIAAFSDFRNAYRRQFCNLSRRIRLLAPMLEEAKEAPKPLPVASEAALRRLGEALRGARELLRLGISGSKIFLVGFLTHNS
jgi:hypothetical protein